MKLKLNYTNDVHTIISDLITKKKEKRRRTSHTLKKEEDMLMYLILTIKKFRDEHL
jgi:hypothetical protein